jgi:hypothetical protein
MAYKITLTYLDGTVKDIVPPPRARIETERHFNGLGRHNAQEATFYMAWTSLKKSGEATEEFDQWIDLLADAEEVEVPAADAPRPTQPAQPADSSSD